MTKVAPLQATPSQRPDDGAAPAETDLEREVFLPPTAALRSLAPGRLIAGKYRLTREIGHGGMGAVWEAMHETLERPVAVKFLKPWSNGDEARAERFVSEAQMMAALKHRFVVEVFDFGVSDEGLYFMVLELLNGNTLAHYFEHGPAFRVHDAIHVIADCLRGLHAVHEAGIVHRDLKPENVVVIEDVEGGFHPKLIDFGISKRKENELTPTPTPSDAGPRRRSRLTAPGMVIGTLDYMAPEQLRGRDDLDHRADVYAMGVILYEWLVGHVPFEQDNIADLIVAITVTGAPPLSRARLDLGPRISGVLAKALAGRADDRYPTALALREALLAALAEIPADAVTGSIARMPLPAEARYSEHAALPTEPQTQPSPQPLPLMAAAGFLARAENELGSSHTRLRAQSRLRPVLLVVGLLAVFGLGAWAVFRPRTPVSILKPRPLAEPAVAVPVEPPASPSLPAASPEPPRDRRTAARERAEGRSTPAAPARARAGRGSKAGPSGATASGTANPRKIYRELDF